MKLMARAICPAWNPGRSPAVLLSLILQQHVMAYRPINLNKNLSAIIRHALAWQIFGLRRIIFREILVKLAQDWWRHHVNVLWFDVGPVDVVTAPFANSQNILHSSIVNVLTFWPHYRPCWHFNLTSHILKPSLLNVVLNLATTKIIPGSSMKTSG